MELDAVDRFGLVGNGSVLRVLGRANGVETLGKVAELVTVRHPDGHGILETLEELVNVTTEASGLQISVTVLTSGASDNVVGVETVSNLLETVADSQNGDTKFEEGGVNVGSVLLVNGVGTAGQDDTLGLPGKVGQLLGARKHLTVDVDLTETAGDKVSAAERVRIRKSGPNESNQGSILVEWEERILLRAIVEHQDGVEGVVGDHRRGHCEVSITRGK